jgi:hypothetical protein
MKTYWGLEILLHAFLTSVIDVSKSVYLEPAVSNGSNVLYDS